MKSLHACGIEKIAKEAILREMRKSGGSVGDFSM
jgi:hypothetical protein